MANGISHSVATLVSQGLSRRMPYPVSVSPEEVAERAVTADLKRQRTPKLPKQTVDLTIKHITSPRALPISRGLPHQRHVSRDSMKSAFAIPTTRTLLIWGRGSKSQAEVVSEEHSISGFHRRGTGARDMLPPVDDTGARNYTSVAHSGFLTHRSAGSMKNSNNDDGLLPARGSFTRRSRAKRSSHEGGYGSNMSRSNDLLSQKSRWSTESLGLPAGTCLNGSPRIIERISPLEREVLQSAATTQFGGVAAENSAESLGRGSSRSPRQAQACAWTEAGGAMGNSLLVAFSSDSLDSSYSISGKRQHIWEMRARNCSIEEIRLEAASKIQRMVRIALGKKFVKRLQVAGKLRCVPPEKRAEIRRKVVAMVERQLPPVTHEAWRFETPWNPFIMGSKFTLSNHLTLKDKPHPFVRLGDAYDDSHLPGADEGHEPLGSRRVWVNTVYRKQSSELLADTMKRAWADETKQQQQKPKIVPSESWKMKVGVQLIGGKPAPARRQFSFLDDAM